MPEPKKPGEYLVATDGSPASDKAVDFAIARAKEAGARLVIIMAVEGNMMGTPSSGGSSSVDLSVQIEKEGWAKVRKDEERARAAGVQARAEIVKVYPPNDIAVAIVKYAEEKRVHSVFVGSHGPDGAQRGDAGVDGGQGREARALPCDGGEVGADGTSKSPRPALAGFSAAPRAAAPRARSRLCRG